MVSKSRWLEIDAIIILTLRLSLAYTILDNGKRRIGFRILLNIMVKSSFGVKEVMRGVWIIIVVRKVESKKGLGRKDERYYIY